MIRNGESWKPWESYLAEGFRDPAAGIPERHQVTLRHLDIKNLTASVGSAGGAGRVGTERGTALGALAELGGMPAVGGLAGAQAHLRSFTFRDSHRMVVC